MQHIPSSRRATPQLAEAPQTGAQRAIPTRVGRPLFRRLSVRWWFTPLLTAATLVCAVSLIAVAYLGARTNALASAQARDSQGAQMASVLLTSNGAGLSVDDNGQLVASGNGSSLILAHDGATTNRLQALTGEGVVIFQVRNGGLTAISTSPALVNSVNTPSVALNGAATLIAQCAPAQRPNCRQQYSGEAQARGVVYVAGFAPLFDQSNALVGVVAVMTPLALVMEPPMQLLVTLSLVGLLVTLAALAAGLWLFGSLAGRTLDDVSDRLGALGVIAASVEETVYTHAVRAQRQERLGRQLAEEAYLLDALANTIEQGHITLQEEVNAVWMGVSQPGGAPDAQAMLRLARQTAVAAARLGADAEDAVSLSRQMSPLMNTLIAEDRALVESAETTERLAGELHIALDQVEMALGSRLAPRPQKALSSLLDRARQVSQRLKRQADSTGPAASPRRPTPPAGADPRRGATGVGVRRAAPNTPGTGTGVAGASGVNRRQTGQYPTPRRQPSGGMGRMPTPCAPQQTPQQTPPRRPSGAQGGQSSGGQGVAKGASSSAGWRTPSNEHPAAPWSSSGEYRSPWLNDLPDDSGNTGNGSGRRFPNHPSPPGRDPNATDTGWLND